MGPSSEENLSLWQKNKAVDECSPLSEPARVHPRAFPDLSQHYTGNGQLSSLADGLYRVVIDADLGDRRDGLVFLPCLPSLAR
jgi:hypothetical protein